jgi:hypothetical protein
VVPTPTPPWHWDFNPDSLLFIRSVQRIRGIFETLVPVKFLVKKLYQPCDPKADKTEGDNKRYRYRKRC